MQDKEFIDLNKKRLQIQMSDLLKQYKPEMKKKFLKQGIFDAAGKEYKLMDIDFKKSCIFICTNDFLSLISVYGLQQINNVHFPDNTSQGLHSRIRTDYMIVESQDIKYSGVSLYVEDGTDDIPASYWPTSYLTKDVAIWRLQLTAGFGKDSTMYTYCNTRIRERYLRNQTDWIFFVGTPDDYRNTYNIDLDIPVYYIRPRSSTNRVIHRNRKGDLMA